MRNIALSEKAAGAILGLLALATVAAAQTPQGRPVEPPGGPRSAGERSGEVRQAMEQMVIARMRVALQLTADQEATVIPRAQELMQARRDHAARRRAAMARLRGLLQDDTAGDKEIVRSLREVRTMEDDFRGREAGLREAIDRDLTPRQQARMVFFEARLRRVMQRRIQDALGGGPGRGPGRNPAPPPGRRPGQPGPAVDEGQDGWDEPEEEP